jgi:inosose dehydratase
VDWEAAAAAATETTVGFLRSVLRRLEGAPIDGFEIWFGHAPPGTITPAVASETLHLLGKHGLRVAACAGSPGDPRRDPIGSDAAFRTALLLDADVIAGDFGAKAIRPLMASAERYGVRVAYENHPESEGSAVATRIEGGGDLVGLALDTGSYVQKGGDPVRLIEEFGPRVVHVHLRDVPSRGVDTSVPLGAGIVDLEAVLRSLTRHGYEGWLSLEIPLEHEDPSQAIIDGARLVRMLLNRVNDTENGTSEMSGVTS